jgi:hypothetical protein
MKRRTQRAVLRLRRGVAYALPDPEARLTPRELEQLARRHSGPMAEALARALEARR